MDRGLFFQDGEKWQNMRNKMNPLFLKNPGIGIANEHSKRITDELIKDLIHHADANAQWYFSRLNQRNLGIFWVQNQFWGQK